MESPGYVGAKVLLAVVAELYKRVLVRAVEHGCILMMAIQISGRREAARMPQHDVGILLM